eukprot:SAG25_NODE_825_length_5177_cov_3.055337_4_plen_92_part_00
MVALWRVCVVCAPRVSAQSGVDEFMGYAVKRGDVVDEDGDQLFSTFKHRIHYLSHNIYICCRGYHGAVGSRLGVPAGTTLCRQPKLLKINS